MADIAAARVAKGSAPPVVIPKLDDEAKSKSSHGGTSEQANAGGIIGLRYNIEVHLPATKEVEVYNAIFKALREHLS